jgi:hypothetical protein
MFLSIVVLSTNVPVNAIVALSFELARQMAAPDFDPELTLHRAQLTRLI